MSAAKNAHRLEHPDADGRFSQFDFQPIAERLYRIYDITKDDAAHAVHALTCFFELKSRSPDTLLLLPKIIDWAWHEAIVDTQFYHEMCQSLCGS